MHLSLRLSNILKKLSQQNNSYSFIENGPFEMLALQHAYPKSDQARVGCGMAFGAMFYDFCSKFDTL